MSKVALSVSNKEGATGVVVVEETDMFNIVMALHGMQKQKPNFSYYLLGELVTSSEIKIKPSKVLNEEEEKLLDRILSGGSQSVKNFIVVLMKDYAALEKYKFDENM